MHLYWNLFDIESQSHLAWSVWSVVKRVCNVIWTGVTSDEEKSIEKKKIVDINTFRLSLNERISRKAIFFCIFFRDFQIHFFSWNGNVYIDMHIKFTQMFHLCSYTKLNQLLHTFTSILLFFSALSIVIVTVVSVICA